MGHADVDQPGLFASGDDFDREPQGNFGGVEKAGCILGLAQRAGSDAANRSFREALETLAKARQAIKGSAARCVIQVLGRCKARRQAHRLLERIQHVELVFDNSRDLQLEAV